MNKDTVSGPVSDQPSDTNFTDVQKRDELAREINARKSVYPGMVRAQRMTSEESEKRQAILTAIWQDYCGKIDSAKNSSQNGEASTPQDALKTTTTDTLASPASPSPANSPLSGNEAAAGLATAVAGSNDARPTQSLLETPVVAARQRGGAQGPSASPQLASEDKQKASSETPQKEGSQNPKSPQTTVHPDHGEAHKAERSSHLKTSIHPDHKDEPSKSNG